MFSRSLRVTTSARSAPLHSFLTLLMILMLLVPTAMRPSTPAFAAGILFEQGQTIGDAFVTHSVAWGDVDNDGDLDLALGYYGVFSHLYRNDNGSLTLYPAWSTIQNANTRSIAWGDVDNDGDLDLALGNYGQPSQLYHNDGGKLQTDPVWSTTRADNTTSIAWGDGDNDGDLDLVLGNYGQPSQLYRNDGGKLTKDPVWSTTQAAKTRSVAWGDVDGDGDLDLALGNDGQGERGQLYLNDGGKLQTDHTWAGKWPYKTLAWGDVDGDGDLDLALGFDYGFSHLYRNDGGNLTKDPVWNSAQPAATESIAWGDVDNDGDLDLALGNYGEPSQLYRNDGGKLTTEPVWSTPQGAKTRSIAWGDVDNDGDLDLVLGNDGEPSRIYRNNDRINSKLLDPIWTTTQTAKTRSVAWGDVDNDGDLDLALGNDGQGERSQLYLNDGDKLQIEPVWTGKWPYKTLAWGDVDGDGDLDLALGFDYGFSHLYRNDGGNLTKDPVWNSAQPAATESIAWGDVDNDGDLDLVLGNYGQPSQLYRNDGGKLTKDPVWSTTEAAKTRSVAWGDVDGDGDLDLAFGGEPSRLYLNDGGKLTKDPVWNGMWRYTTLAWGDVDGDGDLDLALGFDYGFSHLYRNDGGKLTAEPVWSTAHRAATESIAWGDVDNDGDLDLALGNYGERSTIYRNDGKDGLTKDPVWSTPQGAKTRSIAWGDVDNDGDLDLALGNENEPSQLYRNNRANISNPRIYLTQPKATPPLRAANGYAQAAILESRLITFTYTLTHTTSRSVGQVIGQFSLDGGGHWRTAVPTNTATTNLPISPGGTAHTYTWDTYASDVFGQSDNVVFRLVAVPSVRPLPNQAPGSYLYGANASISLPFRLRGTQVRVQDAESRPVPGALVYRLPAGQTRGAQPLTSSVTAQPFQTDLQGFLQGRSVIEAGDQLVAMVPISDTVVYSYTRYHTSAAPSETGLNTFTVGTLGRQTLTISPTNPLLLFHLNVALEWDARRDQQFMSQLRSDIQRVSELLYDWSDGQVALGKVTIYHDRQHWDDADIRIYATNRLRPSADQGGITRHPLTDPDAGDVTYVPGQVRIGTTWNRDGEPGRLIGEDWPRALAHELGHFALYLDDHYLGLDSSGHLVAKDGCPGAMSDPYNDDNSEFRPDAGWAEECKDTLANRSTRRSDWATIKRFYDRPASNFVLRQPASFNANPGPSLLPLVLLQVQEVMPGAPNTTLVPRLLTLTYENKRYEPQPSARAFLFSSDGQRITDLGQPTQSQVTVRGAHTNDRLCVFDSAAERLGCQPILPSTTNLKMSSFPGWRPEVQITPVTSRTLQIAVPAASVGMPAPGTLMARIFPADSMQPPVTATLLLAGKVYSATLVLDAPALEGYVQVWVPGNPELRRETVTDYALGGNPAPNKKPPRKKNKGAPASSADGQVILFADKLDFPAGEFYSIQTATSLPKPPAWASPIGQGYRLLASEGAPDLGKTSIMMAYADSDVPVRARDGIAIYFRPKDGTPWQKLATDVDADHNTAVARVAGEGLYVLMVSIDLRLGNAGWNHLYDYPGATGQSVKAALESIHGKYTTVYGYTKTDTVDPWKVYDTAVPEWVNDLNVMESGQSYWIRTTDPVTVSLQPEHSLSQANELQDNSSVNAPPATYYGILQPSMEFVPAPGMLVVARVNGTVCGQATTQEEDKQVVFAVNVHAAGTGNTGGCGTDGQPVILKVDDYTLPLAPRWDNNRPHELQLHRTYLPLIR